MTADEVQTLAIGLLLAMQARFWGAQLVAIMHAHTHRSAIVAKA